MKILSAQLAVAAAVCISTMATAAPAASSLPEYKPVRSEADWLVDTSPYEAGVYRSTTSSDEIVLANGLIRRTFRLAPNGATVGFDHLVTGRSLLRSVRAEAAVTIDGVSYDVGGLVGQPNQAFILPEWIDSLKADPATLQFAGFEVGEPRERFAWKRVRSHAPGAAWPPKGAYLRMDYKVAESLEKRRDAGQVAVSVHYELYDGIPCMSKWITVRNGTGQPITVDRFTSEILAVVEAASLVCPDFRQEQQKRDVATRYPRPNIHVETDFAFGAFTPEFANSHVVHWESDPKYAAQVNYARITPCLLRVGPTCGPAQEVEPGGEFVSCRAFILPFDSYDRDRKALSLARMYRTIAPWVTENPLMLHVRSADWNTVKNALDQCAEVGFEMAIMSFGSGFNTLDVGEKNLAYANKMSAYAREKGVELGSYALLSSSNAGPDNIVPPEGVPVTHGRCPSLASKWGQDHFSRLDTFYRKSGFMLFEHDGSYPGDVDTKARPPFYKGQQDSRWVQWRIIAEFYRWCRGQGISLNVPDQYYLNGTTKCGMGYREVAWSLPRAQQVIITRQNIYDGTWYKTPSMGWMFVPLTQYHGGGAAATIEPLDAHLDHYRRMLTSNLALGVQACYRGPRLYDTDRTRAMVKHWVDWYKRYRDILESDMIHGRRADGRDVDWMLHVNPTLQHKGMLVVFNPLREEAARSIEVPLYYTGLTETAQVSHEGAKPATFPLARDFTIDLPVTVPGESMTWFVIE